MTWFVFSKFFLAGFFTFVAVIYTVRLTIGDSTSTQAMVFAGNKYSKTWWNHILFRVFRIAIWFICVTRIFFPNIDSYLITFPLLNVSSIVISGMLLMCAGFLIAIVSHKQLGNEWRSGIDPAGPNKLCTNGLYRYTRNPIYVGVITAQIGFFLALPSLFTLLCLLLGSNAIFRQTKAEEVHLKQTLDKHYSVYTLHVPRWLFNR